MENIKQALLTINAHRSSCNSSLLAELLEMPQSEVVALLKEMHKDGLIAINMSDDPTDKEFEDSLILITGGYNHPNYSDIF